MNLLEIRKNLVKISGRFDLVKDIELYEDDGANFYIQAGQRLLDDKFTHLATYGKEEFETKSGQDTYQLNRVKTIADAQVRVDNSYFTLYLTTEEVSNELGNVTEGTPKGYSILNASRLSIRLFPTPISNQKIIVYGRVYSLLANDEDENFWTLWYPETLLSAAMYQIERFHRNTQGMNDYMASIMEDMRNIENNMYETHLAGDPVMGDSFNFKAEGNER